MTDIGRADWVAEDEADIAALRRAAHVLRRRSRKPKGIITTSLIRILTGLADTIAEEVEVDDAVRPEPGPGLPGTDPSGQRVGGGPGRNRRRSGSRAFSSGGTPSTKRWTSGTKQAPDRRCAP